MYMVQYIGPWKKLKKKQKEENRYVERGSKSFFYAMNLRIWINTGFILRQNNSILRVFYKLGKNKEIRSWH